MKRKDAVSEMAPLIFGIGYAVVLDQAVFWGAISFGVHWPMGASVALGVICGAVGAAIGLVTTHD